MMPVLVKNSKQPAFEQVAAYFREQVIQHRIASGEKLPSVRKLASDLGVSNNTIIRAYEQLIQEGYVYTHQRKGLFIEKLEKIHIHAGGQKASEQKKKQIAYRYDLSQAQVDEKIFPLRKWRRMSQLALDSLHYQFTDFENAADLKNELAKYLYRSRGVKASPDQILVLSGTNISITLISILFRDQLKQILFEDPGYAEAREIFESCGHKITSIPVGKRGLDVDSLDKTKNNLLYVTPSHQYPTGAVMPVQQRIRLIQWAAKTDSYIVEDDYDSELRYRGRPIPSLQAIDQHDRVIYCGTFSKVLMPSLRVSYLVLPLKFKKDDTLNYLASTVSFHTQKTLALFIENGLWERHIRKTRKIYKSKYYETIRLIKKIFGDKIQFPITHGGLYILMTVKTKKTSTWLKDQAAQAGIRLVSADNCYTNTRPKHPSFFFGFANLESNELRIVLMTLRKVWF